MNKFHKLNVFVKEPNMRTNLRKTQFKPLKKITLVQNKCVYNPIYM